MTNRKRNIFQELANEKTYQEAGENPKREGCKGGRVAVPPPISLRIWSTIEVFKSVC